MDTNLSFGNVPDPAPPPLGMAGALTVRTHAIRLVGGPLCEVMHHTVTEVIPEVKGVQAFPPAYFNNKQKQKSKGKMKK